MLSPAFLRGRINWPHIIFSLLICLLINNKWVESKVSMWPWTQAPCGTIVSSKVMITFFFQVKLKHVKIRDYTQSLLALLPMGPLSPT